MLRKILFICSLLSVMLCSLPASAQWLNVGPFELQSSLNLSLNYSTNVDQVNDDQTSILSEDGKELDKDDFWIDYGVSLNANGKFFPAVDITASTSFLFEKHFIRDDLDEDADPFYNVSLSADSNQGFWSYALTVNFSEELTAEKQDVAISRTDLQEVRQERDRTTTLSIAPTITWSYHSLSANGGYTYDKETHNDEFSAADTLSQSYNYGLGYQLNRRVDFNWTHSFDKEELIGEKNSSVLDAVETPADVASAEAPVWDESMAVNASLLLMDRPSLTLSGGYSREDTGGEKGEWDPTFSVSLSDTRALASNMDISGTVSYTWEETEEVEDIAFTYSGVLTHQLPAGWSHSLSATREPADTFGSTVDSTSTSYAYTLTQPNFIMKAISFNFGVSREITSLPEVGNKSPAARSAPTDDGLVPEVEGDEETTSWTLGLARSFNLTNSLTASASYGYTLEQVNVEADVIEHLYVLTFSYQL